MNHMVFISAPGKGVVRAEQAGSGRWEMSEELVHEEIRCLAADPNRKTVVYAGSNGRGIFSSQDSGSSWQHIGLDGQVVTTLAVSPHDSKRIFAGVKPAAIFVSDDGGNTWQRLEGFQRIPFRWWWFSPAEKPYQAYVQAISVSPTDPNVLLAGIEFGAVVCSENGGQTWTGHRPGSLRDCHALTFHTRDGSWAYEAGGTGGGASFSRDGGHSWQKAKAGLKAHYGVSCAADPERPEIWYVCVAPGPGKAYGKEAEAYLYRTDDQGGWKPIGWVDHPLPQAPICLVTVPDQPGNLYAGLTQGDVWHSANYGDDWKQLPFNLKGIWRSLIVLPG